MKKPAKKKVAKKDRPLAQADTIFGRIIRQPGRCYICGSTEFIQCAHGFSRRHRNTRWDLRNAWCLCRGCHLKYTHRPLEWDEWLRNEWGEELYWEMRRLALSTEKVDTNQVLADLKRLDKEAS